MDADTFFRILFAMIIVIAAMGIGSDLVKKSQRTRSGCSS